MKTMIIAAVLVSLVAVSPASTAGVEERYTQGTEGVTPHALRPDQLDRMKQHNDEMERHLAEMRALMSQLATTKDAKDRERLLDEHMNRMRAMMGTMRSSSDEMKMGMMAGGPRSGEPMPEGEKLRQHLIEKRIDMMNMMMEQMGRREDVMNPRN